MTENNLNQDPTNFEAVQVIELEISEPLPSLPLAAGINGLKGNYKHCKALIRLAKKPLGMLELRSSEKKLAPKDCAKAIWQAFGTNINAELARRGLESLNALPLEGLGSLLELKDSLEYNKPFVSIVIATHNRAQKLEICLKSLLELDYPEFEIIVIDNAPKDDSTLVLLKTMTTISKYPLRYVKEELAGLSVAHNRGLLEAQGEIIAITDDDVKVDSLWLQELVKGFALAEHVGCVTGNIFALELETPAQVWYEQFEQLDKGFSPKLFDTKDHKPSDPLFPYAVGRMGSGANMAFKASVLQELKGFDPALGAGSKAYGGDELAAFFDVLCAGYAIAFAPAAFVYHAHHRDYDALKRLSYGYGAGFGAYLTKVILDDPRHILGLAKRSWSGIHYLMSAKSKKNAKKTSDFPKEFTKLERLGMLYGPIAYLKSRYASRVLKRDMRKRLAAKV